MLIRAVIQKPDVHPSFSFPTATLESHLLYASAGGLAALLDWGRKGQGGFTAVQKHPDVTSHLALCIRRLTILLSSTSPTHSRSGAFLHHFQTQRLHILLQYVTPQQKESQPQRTAEMGSHCLQLVLGHGFSLVYLI